MKSLFKRTLAAASSSVLALTQLATVAANVNVSAADTETAATSTGVELPIKVDKEYLLYVPISKETPEIGQHSEWNTDLQTALLTMSGDKEFTDNLTDEKETLKRNLLKAQDKAENKYNYKLGCHLDAATIDEIVSKISDTATGKLTIEGEATAEISVDDLGQIAGRIIEDEIRRKNNNVLSIKPDWSSFKIAGKIIVDAEAKFDDKTVSYQITFIDENGKKYTDDKGIEEYALKKLDEVYAILKKAGEDAGKGEKYFEKLATYYNKAKTDESKVRAFADAVKTISGKSDSLKGAFESYKAELLEKASALNTDTKNGTVEDAVYNAIVKQLSDIVDPDLYWSDTRITGRYEKAVNWINKNFAEYVDVQLPLEDIKSIVDGATKSEYSVDGYTGTAVLELEDDKKADVEKAIRDKYEAKWEADGFKIVSIDSHKKLTASAKTDYGVSGDLFYDVERVINVVTEPIVTTITTSDTTTSTTTTTTSTEPTTTSTEPTTTSTEPTTTSTEPTTTSTEPTTTSTEPTTVSTTSTEPTTTSTEPTTISTTDTWPTTISTTNTEPTTVSTTSSSKPDTDTTTSTTITTISTKDTGTTTSSTSTTPGTYISFDIKGVDDTGLIYWSEEDPVEFDLSNLSITLRIFENGEELKDKAIDVTSAFKPNYTSTEGMTLQEGSGCSAYPVDFLLKDVDAVKKAITDAGYGEDLIAQEGIREDRSAGHFTVYIVLRGDVDLDGDVDLRDANQVLIYYTWTMVTKHTAQELIEDEDRIYMRKKDKDACVAYFPYSHYAMDVDGDGQITNRDCLYILRYYTWTKVSHIEDATWDVDGIIGSKKIPREILHSQPLEYDTWAEMYKNAPRALED